MNFFDFRFNDLMKLGLLYSKFLWKCNIRGKYYPDKFVPHNIWYFRNVEMINNINNCKSSLSTDNALR